MIKKKQAAESALVPLPYGDVARVKESTQIKSIRFKSSTLSRLAAAALKYQVSKTHYIELALRNQFDKDEIQ
jgi:hypothetical protein